MDGSDIRSIGKIGSGVPSFDIGKGAVLLKKLVDFRPFPGHGLVEAADVEWLIFETITYPSPAELGQLMQGKVVHFGCDDHAFIGAVNFAFPFRAFHEL